MNFYIVVEGQRSEEKVFPCWIGHIDPEMKRIQYLDEFSNNTFMLVSGNGYPNYFDTIDRAIEDVNSNPVIDLLVVCVDSEEMTYEDKYAEIFEFASGKIDTGKFRIVIQHFCLETWALGNRIVQKPHPHDATLRAYVRHYNTRNEDPEDMPDAPSFGFNRAQFAYNYLRLTVRERFSSLKYSKNKPQVIADLRYFERIVDRYKRTNHIASFGKFLELFEGSNMT